MFKTYQYLDELGNVHEGVDFYKKANKKQLDFDWVDYSPLLDKQTEAVQRYKDAYDAEMNIVQDSEAATRIYFFETYNSHSLSPCQSPISSQHAKRPLP